MAGPTAPNYSGVYMPGADGIRIPTEVIGARGAGNSGGTMAVNLEVDFDVAAANASRGVSSVVTLYPFETAATLLTFNNSSSNNVNFALPAVIPGHRYTLENKCGNNVTFLVTGKTGVTLANNSTQNVVCSSFKGDVIAASAASTGA